MCRRSIAAACCSGRTTRALRPHRGPWQVVDDPDHPPTFALAEAATQVPQERWQRTVRLDSHGTELVHSVAVLVLGTAYGPTQAVRLIAATADVPTRPNRL